MAARVCVGGHDRCYEGPQPDCPYCELRGGPKRTTTWRTCPDCGSRATKILSANSGKYSCQICGCAYYDPRVLPEVVDDLEREIKRLRLAAGRCGWSVT